MISFSTFDHLNYFHFNGASHSHFDKKKQTLKKDTNVIITKSLALRHHTNKHT